MGAPRDESRPAHGFPVAPLAFLCLLYPVYDVTMYFLPAGPAQLVALAHAAAVLVVAAVHVRAGLTVFAVSLIFTDEISRFNVDLSGGRPAHNLMTVSLGGIAVGNVVALGLAAIAVVAAWTAWTRAPRPGRMTVADAFVAGVLALYAAATLHGWTNALGNPRLAINHLNLPIMLGALYLAMRLHLRTGEQVMRFWRWFVAANAAKVVWWSLWAFTGVGSLFGTTLRVGFGIALTLSVLPLAWGLAMQRRGLDVPLRERILALLCGVLAAGVIFATAGRMSWLFAAFAVVVVLAFSGLRANLWTLLGGGTLALAVVLLLLRVTPFMFDTIGAMAQSLRFWEPHSVSSSPSTLVRLYELRNIHLQLAGHGNLLFGDGPGSTFTDRYEPIPFGLFEYDYPAEELERREYSQAHTLFAQLMLQTGYLGMALYLACMAGLYLACFRAYRMLSAPLLKAVALTLLAFLPPMVYMTWNSKANMVLGLLVGVLGAVCALARNGDGGEREDAS